jgi:glycosyltransferase involved in cell wall biosynthesis
LYEATDAANDSLSNKLFESVVAGRPVIAGNLPENHRIVTSYGVGWTTSVDVASLSLLLKQLAADLDTVRAAAKTCHEVGNRHFTWETEIRQVRQRVLDCSSA